MFPCSAPAPSAPCCESVLLKRRAPLGLLMPCPALLCPARTCCSSGAPYQAAWPPGLHCCGIGVEGQGAAARAARRPGCPAVAARAAGSRAAADPRLAPIRPPAPAQRRGGRPVPGRAGQLPRVLRRAGDRQDEPVHRRVDRRLGWVPGSLPGARCESPRLSLWASPGAWPVGPRPGPGGQPLPEAQPARHPGGRRCPLCRPRRDVRRLERGLRLHGVPGAPRAAAG